MMMNQRFKFVVTWITLLIIGGLIASTPAAIIVLINKQPPIYYGGREVLTPEVPPGGKLRIDVSSEIKNGCDATVYRSIVDSTKATTDFEAISRNQIPNQIIELTVPLGATPGTAFYQARIDWSCNFVQKFFPYVVNQQPLKFKIVPLPKQEQRLEQQGVYEPPNPITMQ